MADEVEAIVKVELDKSGVLTDISDRIEVVSGGYGKRAGAREFAAGEATIRVNSDDDFLTPGGFSERDAAMVSGGRVEISARVGSVVLPVFFGRVDEIRHSGDEYHAEFDIQVSDGFSRLAQAPLVLDLPRELTGQRVRRILDYLDYPSGVANRDIDDGTVVCLAQTIEDDALSVLRRCALTEGGSIYVAHTTTNGGVLTFRQRAQRPPASATISDTPDDDPDSLQAAGAPSTQQEQRLLTNRVLFNTPTGEVAVAENVVSQSEYLIHELEQDVYCSLTDAQALADWHIDVYSAPQFRINSVRVSPTFETDAAAVAALGASIGDTVAVKYLPRGATSQVEALSVIEAVRFEFRPLSRAQTSSATRNILTWSLLPAVHAGYWLVGDSAAGVLGESTRLAPPDNTPDAFRGTNTPIGRERWADGGIVTAQAFSDGISSQMPSLYLSVSEMLVSETRIREGQVARVSDTNRLDVNVFTGSRFTRQLEASGEIRLPPIQATITHTRGEDLWIVDFGEPVNEDDAVDRLNYTIDRGDGNAAPFPNTAGFILSNNDTRLLITDAGSPTDGGEVFQILGGTIRDASDDTRFVAAATYEVPEPTTPITATISRFTPKSAEVRIDFSEDVVGTQARDRNNYSLATGTGIVPLPIIPSTSQADFVIWFLVHDFARYGQTFQVLANSIQADDTSGRFVEAASVTLPAQPQYTLTSGGVIGDSALTISTPEPLVSASATNPANFMFANLQGSVSGITYTSGTITIALTERLDGGETFGIRSYGIETTDGNFLQEASWTIAEPTDPVLATISATVGSDVVLVDYSEDVVGSDTETAGVFRLNGALFGFGTTYEYNAGLNRTTITASAPLAFEDEIRVIGGLINVDDSSGRTVRGATFNLPLAPEEVAVTLGANIGGQAFFAFFSEAANAEEASDGSNYLINGRASGAEVRLIPGQFNEYIAVFSTPLALGDTISVAAGNIHNADGSATFVGSFTLAASNNLSYTYTLTADADTNIVRMVFNHPVAVTPMIDNAVFGVVGEFNYFTGDIADGLLSLSGVSGFATGEAQYNQTLHTLTLTLDETLTAGQTLTFHDFGFLHLVFRLYLSAFSYTIPTPPAPPDNRPIITLAAHNRTAAPLLLQWEYSDEDFVQHAIQVRRKSYRTEGRAPNRGLTLERELWPVRHRYRTNNNTRYHHFENAELNDAGDIITSDLTINIPGNWAGGSTPINMAIRAREATGDWTGWSDDFEVDIQRPVAHSPVATFTSSSINASGELTLNWSYTDADGSPQASYALWTIDDTGQTWDYNPGPTGRAGELEREAVGFNTSQAARSALLAIDWQSASITGEDDVVFYLMVTDGNGHRSVTSTIRVDKP